MLGDYVLSAPVVTAGATSRTVLLPPGTWIGWWDGQSYDGGKSGAQVSVPADLDTLPLFLQAGGIVPMLRDTIDTLAPVPTTPTMTCPNGPAGCIDSFANDPGVLWIRIAPGSQSTSFTVYDGSVISQQQKGATLSLSFKPAAAGAVFTEGALFEIVATAKAPSSVSASGASLSQADTLDSLKTGSTGWFWQAPQSPALSGTLWIKVSGATSLAVQ
jgi:alpha-D-xyloside xylohydrolase